ncbi:MAG: cystathionine beta-lyase, partial [Bacteroidales bacterium]|nr:cystathionine beta-lyase [Bacteroidales bacterium]
LVWLDCCALGLPQQDLVSLFMDQAHLLLNDGAMFGPGGEGFMRLNVGCPRSLLADALESLQKALED